MGTGDLRVHGSRWGLRIFKSIGLLGELVGLIEDKGSKSLLDYSGLRIYEFCWSLSELRIYEFVGLVLD